MRWYLLWFTFCFPDDEDTEHLFHMYVGCLCMLRNALQVLCPFFNWVGFFAIELYESSCILNIDPFIIYMICSYFSHPLRQYFSMTLKLLRTFTCLPWSKSFRVARLGSHFLCSNGIFELLRELDITYWWPQRYHWTLYPSPESYHLLDFNSWPLPKEVWLGLKNVSLKSFS